MEYETRETSIPKFLSGGGEMGERIRNFDWENTSLGAPENWDQSLKTCVCIMLSSSQPIWIGWGKELIKLYNDPYKAIVGGKHPNALGQPVSVVWKDIWKDIEPLLKKATETNTGTYVESQLLIMDRNGYQEETYYTFSYTAIPGDKGGTGGIFCANTDDTQRVINERFLKTLRELGTLSNKKNIEEIYTTAANVLERNNKDFPCAVIYRIENDGTEAKAVAFSGIDKSHPELPKEINLKNPAQIGENLAKAVIENRMIISETKDRWKNAAKGGWDIAPKNFVHIPIYGSSKKNPVAVLTTALNPYRKFDEEYQNFIQFVADQISLEVNNVIAFEEERKRAEALAEIDKAKTLFFNNISHEFRTPLTLILGSLEELLNRQEKDSNKAVIETSHRNAMRLLRLVNTLLDFSRIEAGRANAQFELTDIVNYTTNLAGSFRSVIEAAGLTFNVKCDSFIQPVYLDKEMWEKIVLNLLSNAFKYTLQGNITLTLETRENKAILKIKDTGVGIPENELPKIFERFHRVQKTVGRSYEGTGIGLALVSELVKLHSGEISVESKEGQGTMFTVSLPLGRQHLPEKQIVTETSDFRSLLTDTFIEEAATLIDTHSNGTKSSEKNLTNILIVDDNADMRSHIKNLLKNDYDVITAANGMNALHLIKEQPPQLIISDVMMPVMDGLQLLKALKENPKTENIPVILLSARAGEESRIEGYQIGADDYLVKPFTSKELKARISSQLKIKKTRDQLQEYANRIRSILESIPQIAWTTDAIGKIDYFNARWYEFTGLSESESMGSGSANAVHPDDVNRVVAAWHNSLASGKQLETEFRLKNEVGKYKWHFAAAVPQHNKEGEITAWVGTTTNIHDHKLKEQKKDEFISIASHEMKTPLTTANAYIQLLEDSLSGQNDPVTIYAKKASASLKRLNELITELLDVTKIKNGKLNYNITTFDFDEMIESAIENMQYSSPSHLIIKKGKLNQPISGDKERLEQVVINLLSNAIKYSPGAGKVFIKVGQADNEVKVSVKDKGIGISKNNLKKIFERYYRVEEQEVNFQGLGIGLFISSEIIERHHGKIWAESEPGKGSTFYFTLPIS